MKNKMKELTNFLEDEGFYSDEERQVRITVSLKDLRFILEALKNLQQTYESDYEAAIDDDEISDLGNDIKFVESLHSYLNLELEDAI